MPRMPTFEEIRADFERGVHAAEQRIEHPRHGGHLSPQTPAQPVNLAPDGAANQGERMSLITDVEDGYQAVETEIAKLKQSLPAALGVARQLENNPLVAVALKAAEHLAAGVLPPEALAYLSGTFLHDLEAMASWYAQGQQPQPQPVPPQPQPAQ